MSRDHNPYREGSVTLTREEYVAVRKYLDSLKPDLYAKCGGCGLWFSAAAEQITLHFDGAGQRGIPRCESCEKHGDWFGRAGRNR